MQSNLVWVFYSAFRGGVKKPTVLLVIRRSQTQIYRGLLAAGIRTGAPTLECGDPPAHSVDFRFAELWVVEWHRPHSFVDWASETCE